MIRSGDSSGSGPGATGTAEPGAPTGTAEPGAPTGTAGPGAPTGTAGPGAPTGTAEPGASTDRASGTQPATSTGPAPATSTGTARVGSTAATGADATPAAEAGHYPDLAGRVAVVTGGSRGIGAATAAALAANGAIVALIGRDTGALQSVTAAITASGGQAAAFAADCTQAQQLEQLAASVTNDLGPADIVAAFAGGDGMPVATWQETPEHWRELIETNLNSAFYTVRAFLPGLISRRRGAIITMASAAGRQAAQSAGAYATAKAGVIGLTRHLAGELAPYRIRVNCLAPSATENDRMRAWMQADQIAALGASFPLGRIAQPADVAAAALFLASDASAWITGATLDVAGGKVML